MGTLHSVLLRHSGTGCSFIYRRIFMELKVICKRLITQNLDENITEGEYGADIIGITVPRMYGEHDLSTFSFRLTAVSKQNESVAEQVLTMDSAGEENIHLLWEVTSDFTASSGEVTLILAGVNLNNTVQIKFTSQPMTIKADSRLEFIESPTILEQAYNQVQLEVQKAINAAERAEEITSNPIIVPVATEKEIGGIVSGDDISIAQNGAVTVNSVGGKTVGVSVPKDAVFTDTVYTLPVASVTTLGGVKVDNKTIKVNSDGIISSTVGSSVESGRVLSKNTSYKITDAVCYPLIFLNLYGNSTQDGTPTPEDPVQINSIGDDVAINITSCGKNLLNIRDDLPITVSGVTISRDNTGNIILNGTATAAISVLLSTIDLPYNTYTMSIDSKIEGVGIGCANFGSILLPSTQNSVTIKNSGSGNMRLNIRQNIVLENFVLNPQIEIGSAATKYEPYKGNTAEITSGLPLCSVGDVCDELIYNADGTGKIIKRTAKLDSYNGEVITTNYISSTGGLDTGATVVYVLENPIEIKFSTAEIAVLMELQTYDGMTNIFNSDNAEMEVKICTNNDYAEYIYSVLKRILS